MSNNEAKSPEEKSFEVITYEDEAVFKYTLPDEAEEQTIECELTFIWEDTLEKFLEEHGSDKPYRVKNFTQQNQYNFYIHQIETRTEEQLEAVEEEIANKMKYGFEFTGQLHNDD